MRYNTFVCTEDQNALITINPEGQIEEIEFIYRTPQSGTYKHQFYRRSGNGQPKLTDNREKVRFAFYLLGKRNPSAFRKLCTTFADNQFRKELKETLQKIKEEYNFDFS